MHSKTPKAKTKKNKGRIATLKSIWRILRDKELIRLWKHALSRFFKQLSRSVTFQTFSGNFRIGFMSPVQTGLFMGIWYVLEPLLTRFLPASLQLDCSPDFTNKKISGIAEIAGKTSLIRLLAPVFILFIYAPYYRTYKQMQL